jgi:tetratricopeptide (TPR) repeat protein
VVVDRTRRWLRSNFRSHLLDLVRRRLRIALAFSVFAFFIAAALLYVKLQSQPIDRASPAVYQPESRLRYWASALQMWRYSPWTGVGLSGYATAYPHFKQNGVENTRFAHSFPLQMLAETGIVGVVTWIYLAIAFARRYRRGRDATTARYYLATLGIVLAYSMITIHMDFLLNKVMLLLLMGTALDGETQPSVPARGLYLATAGVSLVLLSAFWSSSWTASRLYQAGVALEAKGQTDQARDLFEKALTLSPKNADSHWKLAQLYSAQDPEKAAMHVQAARNARKDIRFGVSLQ